MTRFVVVGFCPLKFKPGTLVPATEGDCITVESAAFNSVALAKLCEFSFRECVRSPGWKFEVQERYKHWSQL